MSVDWTSLSERFARAQALAVDRRRYLEACAGRHFDEWCSWAEEHAMAAVAAAAKRRSAMIADHGPSIIVRYPSSSALSLEAGSPETVHQRMRFAAFCLGRSRVQVYSARQDGGWPHLHLVSTPLRKGRRHARLVSLPGCRVVPDEKYGLVLYDLADRLVPPRLTSPDDFVYRAFELLAAEAFRATKGHELERVAW